MEATNSLETGERFRCLICLDLVFKPIVQSCGHVFCFWCVHRAMDSKKQSQCPVCRRPYIHFPRVCALLHFSLIKALPRHYKARAREIQDMEESEQVFSPRITISPRCLKSTSPQIEEAQEKKPCMKLVKTVINDQALLTHSNSIKKLSNPLDLPHRCGGDLELITEIKGANCQDVDLIAEIEDANEENNCKDLAPQDFPCALCNQLLYRPVVLNCGQAFCESCVKKPNSNTLLSKCPSCECPHPGASIHVCLELHNYLEATFPSQYQQRKEEISSYYTNIAFQVTKLPCNDSCLEEEQHYDQVHEGVGCDGCGMFPIVGKRYRCKDCPEKVGYDLCGECKGSVCVDGRFNQQHGAHHEMEEVVSRDPESYQHVRVRRINHVAPLILNLESNALIQRRQIQHQQILFDDFDDYIDCLMP